MPYVPPTPYVDLPSQTTPIWAADLNTAFKALAEATARVLSVKDPSYGAKGDGFTDDTTAIQSALNQKGRVYFPIGTYKITSALTVLSDTVITGAGRNSIINQTSTTAHGLSASAVDHVIIRDICVQGPNSGSGDGIHFAKGSNANTPYIGIQNVDVLLFGNDGISMESPIVSSLIDVVTVTNGRYGINLFGQTGGAAGTSCVLASCFGNGNTTAGIRLYNMVYTSLNGCANDSQPTGYLIDTCQSVALNGCGAESNTTNGFKVNGGYGITLTSPWVYDNRGVGIYITGSANTVTITGAMDNTPNASATNFIKMDAGSHASIVSQSNATANSLPAATTTTMDAGGRITAGGPITALTSTTSGRPSASGAGTGAMIYDTTLSQPIWSNGSAWATAASALFFNVKDYGAKGDGTTDDTTALNNAKAAAVTATMPLFIPPGTYKITSMLNWAQDGLIVIGAGPQNTVIEQFTSNTPIMRVGGQAQHIEGIRLTFNTAQTSSNTSGNGMEFLTPFMCNYRFITVEACANGFFLPTTLGTNDCFSCTFQDLRVNGFAISALDFQSTNSFSTGNVFTNLYFQNNYSGSVTTNSGIAVRFSSCDEMTVHQMNIEWSNPASDVIMLYQCKNTVVSTLHFEQLTPTSAAAGLGFIRMYDSTRLNLQGVTFSHNTINASMGTFGAFRIGGNNCSLDCSGIGLNTNTVSTSGTTNTLVYFDSAQTGCSVDIRNASLGDYAVTIQNDSSPPSVKRINDALTLNSSTTLYNGNIVADTAGYGLQIKEGTNAKMGTATLSAGAATVSTTAVTASSRIFLTNQALGGTAGFLRVSARTAGTSFTITSSSGTDTSTVAWMLVEPAP